MSSGKAGFFRRFLLPVIFVLAASFAFTVMASAAEKETGSSGYAQAECEDREVFTKESKRRQNFLAWDDVFVTEYDYGVGSELLKAEYSGNYLILKFAIINNSIRKISKFSHFTVKITYNGRKKAVKTFHNVRFSLSTYSKKKLTLKIPFSRAKQKKVHLNSEDFYAKWEFKYIYHF